ncbi:MAG: MerR family transcriptional regulator [Bacteroidales bacterium]|nr:MerR family transcriptional regulator [Bacteroidales bacterium]
MEKIYYTIGEVAEILGESTSLVRFWANSFPRFIKPTRTTKGNRQFTPSDIEALKKIHFLVKENGMTLDGAAKRMAADAKGIEAPVQILDSLKDIRSQLAEIRKSL